MCKTAEREGLAEQYVRGQLGLEKLDEFELHLLECRKCLGRVETLNEIQLGLKAHKDIIREAEVVRNGRPRLWLMILTLLAIAAVTVGSWYYWK